MRIISLAKVLIILPIAIITGLPAFANITDETTLLSSAEKTAKAWEQLLSKGIDLASCETRGGYYKYWHVMRFKYTGNVGFDIRKTDSIVSPYMLIINFETNFWDNARSPNANGHFSETPELKKWYGFKTSEEALNNVKPIDFDKEDVINCTVYYAFQKGFWVYKGGNDYFEGNFERHLKSKETSPYFKDILSIPVN